MAHIPRNYIATLEQTTIQPIEGLAELRYIASVCDDNRRVPLKRKSTALALSKHLHMGRDTIQVHLNALTRNKLISKVKIKRKWYRQIAEESELARFIK